jgi:polar amino acid transport system permease protein
MSWKDGGQLPDKREVLWSAALLVGVSLVSWAVFASVKYQWHWEALIKNWPQVMVGWGWTLLISAVALVLSILLGAGLMLGQRSAFTPVRLFSRGYLELVRGTPLLVQLLLGYYVLANALHVNARMPVGIVLLAMFEGTYLSEIFRAALESISASQLEAARAVGFDSRQIWRYVIFPQAIRRALPGSAGQMVSLIKDSSLLSVIGIEEVTRKVELINAHASLGLEGFIPLAVLYLVLTLPLSWWTRRLEQKFKYET